MSDYDDVLETSKDGKYRVKLVPDTYADEPYDDGQSPLLRLEYDHGYWHAEHIQVGGRPTDDDARIEEAIAHWTTSPSDSDWPKFEKYLRVFYGVTEIVTWSSGNYWYVTYDSAAWREYTGALEGSANLDEYRAWCEGDVWGYVVEKNVTWQQEDDPDERMQTWETVDDSWVFYGYELAKQSALEAYQYIISKETSK